MNHPLKHTVQTTDGKYNYLLFDSVLAFNTFVDDETKNLSSSNQSRWDLIEESTDNQIQSGTDRYGTPTPKTVKELNEHRTFLGMPLVFKRFAMILL